MTRAAFVTFIGVLVCADVSYAGEQSKAGTSDTTLATIKVWHREQGGVQVEGKNRPKGPLVEDEHFMMQKRARVSIAVLDANPLLFLYDARKGSSTPSPNDLAAEKFLRAGVAFAGLMPQPAKTAAAPEIAAVEDIELEKFRETIRRIDDAANSIPSLIDESLKIYGLTISEYNTAASAFQEKTAGWPELIKLARSYLQKLDSLHAKCASRAQATVSVTPPLEGGAQPGCGSLTIRALVDPFDAYRAVMTERVELIEEFRSDVQKFAVVVSSQVPYERTDTSLIVDIKPNQKYASLLTKRARDVQSAASTKVTVPLRAHSSWTFSAGPSFVIAYVKDPTFKAVQEGAKFRPVAEGGGKRLAAYSAGVMIDMQHQSLADPSLGLSFQAGFTPTKDRLGVFGGAALSFQEGKLTLGAGYIHRQITALADDLPELLDSPDKLKTRATWKGGGGYYFVLAFKPWD